MGGKLCLPRYSCCMKQQTDSQTNHTQPRSSQHRRNVSATFNLSTLGETNSDSGYNHGNDQLNINSASEEELMTLPGINRATAHNIVEYRRKLGPCGFKMVEDLALVSGVGATKMEQIRCEITVGPKKRTSQANSINSSRLDLIIQDDTRMSGGLVYNVHKTLLNNSNMFQLMRCPGINQKLAENIIDYRNKHGMFRSVDELVKVRGIKPPMINALRPYLALNAEETGPSKQLGNGDLNGGSYPRQFTGSQDDLISLYGPLSRRSFRERRQSVARRKDAVRLSTWNLDACTQDKAENPGVREVIAMTILENGFDLVLVQDIIHSTALFELCDELNSPSVPNVRKWEGNRGRWQSVVSTLPSGDVSLPGSYVGCMYRQRAGWEVSAVNLLHSDHYTAHSIQLTTEKSSLTLTNVDMRSLPAEDDLELSKLIQPSSEGATIDVLAGSFLYESDHSAFSSWKDAGYKSVLPSQTSTDVHTPESPSCHHDIWLSSGVTAAGEHGVVREGLSNPWIPCGWSWGGVVSQHCPVWTELML